MYGMSLPHAHFKRTLRAPVARSEPGMAVYKRKPECPATHP